MGVSMSTFLSCPSLPFFTLTLQPGSTRALNATAAVKISSELASRHLSMRMLRSLLCRLGRPLNAGATLSDVGNADRQVAMNGHFSKERFDRAGFRDASVGKCAKAILDDREILRHGGIYQSKNLGFFLAMVLNRMRKRPTTIGQ